jgi:hypothetical protein
MSMLQTRGNKVTTSYQQRVVVFRVVKVVMVEVVELLLMRNSLGSLEVQKEQCQNLIFIEKLKNSVFSTTLHKLCEIPLCSC